MYDTSEILFEEGFSSVRTKTWIHMKGIDSDRRFLLSAFSLRAFWHKCHNVEALLTFPVSFQSIIFHLFVSAWSHEISKIGKKFDGYWGNPIIFAHLSSQIFAEIETRPDCFVGEEPIRCHSMSYFDQPCACHNYYNQLICYCFDMNINYSLFNLPKKMLALNIGMSVTYFISNQKYFIC